MFDLPLLRTLLAVADTRGFTRAGERLSLTQSAISAHIRRLESEAGCKLVDRTTRTVSLTAAGVRLASYARTIAALHSDACASVGPGRQLAGRVSVGLSEEIATPQLFEDLRRLSAAQPRVETGLTIGFAGDLSSQLESGVLDIMLGSLCSEAALADKLWAEPLIWAAGPASDRLSPDSPIPLVVFPDACPYRAAAIAALAAAGRSWRIVCQSPSIASLMLATQAGLGFAPMTRRSAIAAGLREMAELPVLSDAQFHMAVAPRPTRIADLFATELRASLATTR